MTAAGIPLVCCDHHMGPVCPEACERLCDVLGVPFLYPVVEPHVELASSTMLSTHEGNETYADKKAWLLRYIARLTPGIHYLCVPIPPFAWRGTRPALRGVRVPRVLPCVTLSSCATPGTIRASAGWALTSSG